MSMVSVELLQKVNAWVCSSEILITNPSSHRHTKARTSALRRNVQPGMGSVN